MCLRISFSQKAKNWQSSGEPEQVNGHLGLRVGGRIGFKELGDDWAVEGHFGTLSTSHFYAMHLYSRKTIPIILKTGWWLRSIATVLGKQRQEDGELQGSPQTQSH